MAHLTQVKARLSIHAHRKVRGLLEGEYAALQVGRGMEFNDLRSYVRGDDVKDLDWKASARARTLLVRRYVTERRHTVLLCVSTGRTMAALDAAGAPKRDAAVLVAGVIGQLAVRHGDRVALVHGDRAHQHVAPPAEGELALERMLETIHDAITPDGAASDLAAVLGYAASALRRRAIMVVVSDERSISDEVARLLRRLRLQHEVLFVGIGDLDPTGLDAVAGELVDVDDRAVMPAWLRADPELARQWAAVVEQEDDDLRAGLDQLGIVHERVSDADTAVGAIFRLLERHRHARR